MNPPPPSNFEGVVRNGLVGVLRTVDIVHASLILETPVKHLAL